MMDDLIAFLRARLDEREQTAPSVHSEICDSVLRYVDSASVMWPVGDCNCGQPEWVLADIASKRALLDWLVDCHAKALDGDWWNLEVEDAVRLLALPYAGHADYREEWRV